MRLGINLDAAVSEVSACSCVSNVFARSAWNAHVVPRSQNSVPLFTSVTMYMFVRPFIFTSRLQMGGYQDRGYDCAGNKEDRINEPASGSLGSIEFV